MALIVNIQKQLAHFELNVQFETSTPGEVVALLGPSGCGKSMTLKCLAGIVKPDAGYIELDGRVLFDSAAGINMPAQKRRLGYLFQNYALFPTMSALANVACAVPAEVATSRRERETEARRLLALLKVEELAELKPARLSGGQQQRVAMARMLAARPACLLFDEPTSALDSYLQWTVELEVAEIMRSSGVPSVLVSHNRDEVYRLSDSVCVLDRGKATRRMSMQELFSHPETVAAAQISGCKNICEAQLVGEPGQATGATLQLQSAWGATLSCPASALGQLGPEQVTHVGVRAHYLKLFSATEMASVEEPLVAVKVVQVIDAPFSVVLMVGMPAGGALRVELSKERWAELAAAGVEAGSRAWLEIPAEAVMPLTGSQHESTATLR